MIDIDVLLRRAVSELRAEERAQLACEIEQWYFPRGVLGWLRVVLTARAARKGRYVGKHRPFPRAVVMLPGTLGPHLWLRTRPPLTRREEALATRAVRITSLT